MRCLAALAVALGLTGTQLLLAPRPEEPATGPPRLLRAVAALEAEFEALELALPEERRGAAGARAWRTLVRELRAEADAWPLRDIGLDKAAAREKAVAFQGTQQSGPRPEARGSVLAAVAYVCLGLGFEILVIFLGVKARPWVSRVAWAMRAPATVAEAPQGTATDSGDGSKPQAPGAPWGAQTDPRWLTLRPLPALAAERPLPSAVGPPTPAEKAMLDQFYIRDEPEEPAEVPETLVEAPACPLQARIQQALTEAQQRQAQASDLAVPQQHVVEAKIQRALEELQERQQAQVSDQTRPQEYAVEAQIQRAVEKLQERQQAKAAATAGRRPSGADVELHLNAVSSGIKERQQQELQAKFTSVLEKAAQRKLCEFDLSSHIEAGTPSDVEVQDQIKRAMAAAAARSSPAERVAEAQVAAATVRQWSLAKLGAAVAEQGPADIGEERLPAATWDSEDWVHGGRAAAVVPAGASRPPEAARLGALMVETVRSTLGLAPAAAMPAKKPDQDEVSPRKWGGC